ncbi:hypothetical protein [Nostocoides sp.]|jgi:hypothetical protein|uniref:hypothetical protein n=1 Tax=Nostocoides sp. TaxID=1917966 RepID=UPI003BB0040A
MPNSTSTLLTDDEIVATQVVLQRGYPLPLPTIRLTDPEDLARAATRGLRSLELRAIALDPSDATSPLALVSEICGRHPFVSLQLVVAEGQRAMARRFDAFRGESLYVCVVSNGLGVHELATTTATGIHRHVTEMCREAQSATDGTRLILVARTDRPTGFLVGTSIHRVAPSGPSTWRAGDEVPAALFATELTRVIEAALSSSGDSRPEVEPRT